MTGVRGSLGRNFDTKYFGLVYTRLLVGCVDGNVVNKPSRPAVYQMVEY